MILTLLKLFTTRAPSSRPGLDDPPPDSDLAAGTQDAAHPPPIYWGPYLHHTHRSDGTSAGIWVHGGRSASSRLFAESEIPPPHSTKVAACLELCVFIDESYNTHSDQLIIRLYEYSVLLYQLPWQLATISNVIAKSDSVKLNVNQQICSLRTCFLNS